MVRLSAVYKLEKRALSPDMAIRVGRLTNTTPESWLQRNETLLELAKLEFNLRLPAKRYQRKSSPGLGPAHQDFVH